MYTLRGKITLKSSREIKYILFRFGSRRPPRLFFFNLKENVRLILHLFYEILIKTILMSKKLKRVLLVVFKTLGKIHQ